MTMLQWKGGNRAQLLLSFLHSSFTLSRQPMGANRVVQEKIQTGSTIQPPSPLLGQCKPLALAQQCCDCVINHVGASVRIIGPMEGAALAQHQYWPRYIGPCAGWVWPVWSHFWAGGRREGGWNVSISRVAQGGGGAKILQLYWTQTSRLRDSDPGHSRELRLAPAK